MALKPEDFLFYKNLYSVLNEPNINDLLVKYTKIGYDKAINSLKTANEPIEIGRLQGKIEVFEAFLGLKKTVFDILKGAQ